MIFIHSGFRTGSTHMWSRVRACESAVAYFEVCHELLGSMTTKEAMSSTPWSWPSGHPDSAPYFMEFVPLIKEGGGVELYHPWMAFDTYVPAGGCGAGVTPAEAAYVQGLVEHAQARDRVPVLTCTRTLGRMRGFSVSNPGMHVALHRNLFRHWCSYSEQGQTVSTYFTDRLAHVMRSGLHDPTLRAMDRMFPTASPSIHDPGTFYAFTFLHLHMMAMSIGAADLIVDIDRVETSREHRAEVEAAFAAQGVPLNLAGTKNRIGYSMVNLGKRADVEERLRVIGAVIADGAPDQCGRDFCKNAIEDLIEERNKNEFHVSGLRSLLIGPKGALARAARADAAEDALARERQRTSTLQAELDTLRATASHADAHVSTEATWEAVDAVREATGQLVTAREAVEDMVAAMVRMSLPYHSLARTRADEAQDKTTSYSVVDTKVS